MMHVFINLLAFTLALNHIVLAAVPRPAWDCVDDKIIAKYHDEPCTSDEDCFGRSMHCEGGKCACKEDYVPGERFVGEQAKQTVCVSAPSLFAECATICQRPYVCKQHAELKKKLCHCEPPFKLVDNHCHMECQANEDYDSSKFRCIPKCKANEMKVNDTCLKLGQINDACAVDKQCLAAFSECKAGKCSCLEGFTFNEGSCVPDEVRCPNGQVIKPYTKCIFLKDTETQNRFSAELKDNCPSNHFCHTVSGGYKSEGGEGICCPRVESQCPVGKVHHAARCRASSLYKDNDQECPWDSHYCTSSQNGGDTVCCPRRCEASMIYINGKCYQPAKLNDPCLENNQCTEAKTSCVNGFCKCNAGVSEIKRPTYSYCAIECTEDEMLHGNQCHKRLSLGDSCLNQTWRCPSNAFCNKFNVCSCSCPRFTLSKDICAPVPICPSPKKHYPMMHQSSMMEMSEDAMKYYTPITDEKRRLLLENVTFCAVDGKQPPKAEHVQQCPDGQYCANFIAELGMCCQIPDYVCPNGKKPISSKQCSPKNALSCGLKHYCHDYLYTANADSADGKLCCEKDENDDLF